MNWKPATAAALVVAIVGLIAGVAIGGKTDTKTTTVTQTLAAKTTTVEKTVTAPADVTSDTTATTDTNADGSLDGTDTNADGTLDGTGSGEPATDPYYLDSDSQLTTNKGELYSFRTDQAVQLQRGPEIPQSTIFELNVTGCCPGKPSNPYEMQMAIPDGYSTFETKMGFIKGTSSSDSVRVSFYQDDVDTKPLRTYTVRSTVPVDVSVPVSSAGGLLLLKFTPVTTNWPDDADFVLGGARFE